MATPITLTLRQEVLATEETYVAVNEVTSVSGLTGAAQSDAGKPFVITRMNSGRELFKEIIAAKDLGTIAYNNLSKFLLVWGSFNPSLLPDVTKITVYYPEYWQTKHAGTIDSTAADGALAEYGDSYTFTSSTVTFTEDDEGKKIEITSGDNTGIYPIVQWIDANNVVITSPVDLDAPESSIPFNVLSYLHVAVGPAAPVTDTTGTWVRYAGGVIPSQVPDVDSNTITLDLRDSTSLVQAGVKALPVREDQNLTEFRDNVFYAHFSTYAAAANHNTYVLKQLENYVDELNTTLGLVGSHLVETTTVS